MRTLPPLLSDQQLTEALAGFPSYASPPSLYRFQSNAGLSALTEGKLKITPPDEFNDPFEMSPGIAVDGLSKDDLRRSFLSPRGLSREGHAHRFENEKAYRDWVERVVIMAPHLWGKHLDAMRNAPVQGTSETYGITCFSAFPEAVLNGPLGIRHWAMYAKDHTGFVIEYDGRHALLKSWATSKWLFPVAYQKNRPIVNIAEFDEWTQEKAVQVLRRWSEMKCKQAWGEEMEWRLICPLAPDPQNRVEISSMTVDGRKLHFLHLWKSDALTGQRDAKAIKRVILGVRVDAKLEADIKATMATPDFQHAELHRAILCKRDFALRTEPVKP